MGGTRFAFRCDRGRENEHPVIDRAPPVHRKDTTMALAVIAATLSPGGIIAWLIVGAIAGALAGMVMKGGGYGIIGDIIVGIIGAFIGGFIVGIIAPNASFGLIGSIIVAFIGACILIAILRAVSGNRAAV